MDSSSVIKSIRVFLITLLLFITIDSLVINALTSSIYKSQLKEIIRADSSILGSAWWSVLLVYILISFALTYYVIIKEKNNNELNVFLKGIILGFVIYGIFEFSNYSLINNWSGLLLLVDIIWGTVLCGLVAFITFYINKLFK
mgnify:CR=1 FL=1